MADFSLLDTLGTGMVSGGKEFFELSIRLTVLAS
jgi:hypothetical protein